MAVIIVGMSYRSGRRNAPVFYLRVQYIQRAISGIMECKGSGTDLIFYHGYREDGWGFLPSSFPRVLKGANLPKLVEEGTANNNRSFILGFRRVRGPFSFDFVN